MAGEEAWHGGAGGDPIACHAAAGIVARRGGQALGAAAFRRHAAALAARLPEGRYIVNLCTDRYRFMVGFAAALRRGQVSLMPAASVPGALLALTDDYPGLYALTDAAVPPVRHFPYPDDLDASGLDASGAMAVPPPCLPADRPAVIQFTSGSTGRPKPVPKSWQVLVNSARAAGARLGTAGLRGATIIGTVPHQHSYGLESVILLALQNGFAVEAGTPLYPGDIRAALARAPWPRILVTTPVHLRALLAEPDELPGTALILSATAPLPVSLAEAAEARFGAPLIEIYGCTEAGQVATRRTAREVEWRCFDGIALRQDDAGNWASGPAVEGVAPLQDMIELTGPGRFRLGARAADLVNIAGKRTSFTFLTHQLLSIPGVEDGVFLLDDAQEEGPQARLAAVAVAPGLTPDVILRALRERVDAAFLPRPLLLVEALPRNELGKLPREKLLHLLGRAP